MTRPTNTRKAFVVIPKGWPLSDAGLYADENASRVRYRSFLGSKDAGFNNPLSALRVLRLPALDEWAARQPGDDRCRGWSVTYVPGALDALRDRMGAE